MATAAERAKLAAAMKPQKRSKYGNNRTVLDGLKFDSKRESKRWAELKLMEKARIISDLRRQVPFALHAPGGALVSTYIADFVYIDKAGNSQCEDSKGAITDVYALKKRHMLAEYKITIKEV